MNDSLRRLLEPLATRLKLIVGRGLLELVDEARKVRELQVTALRGEVLGRVEHFQHFGLTSRPPPGSEVVLVFAGGSRDHPLAIAEEHRPTRPAGVLAAGETLLYNAAGVRVLLRADNSVVVTAAALEASGDVDAAGDVLAGGDVEDSVGTLDAFRQAYNVHTHSDPQGGTTGPPVPTA